jgi:sugar/nucleoside kinase (ribokinase family)
VDRLVVLGSVIVDVVMFVPGLPPRGGDVLATDAALATGGGFNVLSAAARQGLPAALAGRHGTGPFGDLARRDLAAAGVELLLPRAPGGDTGFCVGLVEADERTYATHPGVEGSLTAAELATVGIRPADAVYLSGYDLAYPHGDVVADWFAALPDPVVTIFDPGPLVAELPAGPLRAVLGRVDWLSANLREARLMTGTADADGADGADDAQGAEAAAARLAARRGVVVRAGAAGCVVAAGGAATHVPVPGGPVTPVDPGGAGDAHVGAFAAALARGLPPAEACRWANAAAARCVRSRGPATAPPLAVTRADVLAAPSR